jgi:hypothetical protein
MTNICPDITLSKGCVLLSQADKLFSTAISIPDTLSRGYGVVVKSNNRKINKLLHKATPPKKEGNIVVFFARYSSSGNIWYKNNPCVIVPNNGILGVMELSNSQVKECVDNRKREARELLDELESSQRGQRIY